METELENLIHYTTYFAILLNLDKLTLLTLLTIPVSKYNKTLFQLIPCFFAMLFMLLSVLYYLPFSLIELFELM